MITAIRVGKLVDYTSEKDEGEPKTVFKLGVIDYGLMAELQDEYGITDPKQPGRWNQLSAELLRFGLRGFENFKDPDGNAVLFQTHDITRDTKVYKVPTDETINTIPFEVRVEIAAKILQMNTISEDERKNSNAPSSSAA